MVESTKLAELIAACTGLTEADYCKSILRARDQNVPTHRGTDGQRSSHSNGYRGNVEPSLETSQHQVPRGSTPRTQRRVRSHLHAVQGHDCRHPDESAAQAKLRRATAQDHDQLGQ